MHLAELMVIYLAYGAPFGVYEVTSLKRKVSITEIQWAAAKFVFWPVVVAFWIHAWLFRDHDYNRADIERTIDVIRNNLESIAFDDRSAASILQFREVFARYTGLTLMVGRSSPSPNVHPLFELGNQVPDKTIIVCNYRRDYQRMAFHQLRARKEFLEIIARSSALCSNHDDLILSSVELAVILNDSDCIRSLSAMLTEGTKTPIGNPISAPKAAS